MEQEHLGPLDAPRISTAAIPEAPTTATIPDAINIATRRQHTTLNRLIIERIPLALPPNAVDPATYGHGIAAFAKLYYAFEQVWDEVVDADARRDPNDESHEARLLHWLATLRPPGLVRSRRLGSDLHDMSCRTGLSLERDIPALDQVLRRTRQSLRDRPHTLVAHAWVMYMALFSGGRWIRQVLSRAGPAFWWSDSSEGAACEPSFEKQNFAAREMPGFAFLFFDDGKDGNAIKAEFKSRLAEAEILLSQKERRDIVKAATSLFDDCIAIVGMLDQQNNRQVTWSQRRRKLCILGLTAAILGFAAAAGLSMYFGWARAAVELPLKLAQRLGELRMPSLWERLPQRRGR